LTGRREEELASAVAALGERASGVPGNVAKLADLDRVFAAIEEIGSGLDVVFANADGGSGIALNTELTPASFDDGFDKNVRGTVFTVQKALPLLRDGGSIVITGSSSARRAVAGYGVYSATEAAPRQFVRVWAAEVAERCIRVNVIVPGLTDTPALRNVPTDVREGLSASVPLGRLGRPEEIASAVLFLATDQSIFVTGSELFADGGEVQADI
jgi:NAD(P)-dependent dehydrogenase (short-subunit alcohol dehydrogenase family)